jgi:hypothetical protein
MFYSLAREQRHGGNDGRKVLLLKCDAKGEMMRIIRENVAFFETVRNTRSVLSKVKIKRLHPWIYRELAKVKPWNPELVNTLHQINPT